MVKNSDVQKLKDEISRLMAALEDVNFECQRLEIINSNLDFQLKDPEIFADPFHLIHLVDNLISNALKYAGEKTEIQIS